MATYTSNYGWTKPSGSDNVDISVLNDNLDDQDITIHDAFLNMAPPFSESSTYAVDDIVLYGTGLYKCHTAVVTPGSWTGSTNWQVYKLSEGGSGGGGTSNYNDLTNKPSINGVTLSGNKTTSDLGIDKTAVGLGNVPNVSTNDQTPTFTQASTRNNIASGEKLSVIMGKIQKFFNDLKTVAFSGSYTDLSNTPTIPSQAQDISYGNGTVKDALDEVTTTTSLVLSNSTYLYENGVARKKNGVVCVTFNGFKGLTNNVTTDILNLIPSNMRPSYTISAIAFAPGAAGGEMYRVKINNTGTVSVYPYTGISLQNNLIVTLTYVS